MRRFRVLVCAALALSPAPAGASSFSDLFSADRYTLHFQSTVVQQGSARIRAPYTGPHSFLPDPQRDVSVTSTLFTGWRPLPSTSFFFSPEMSGGQGLSGAQGIAGFPNGETYRIGSPAPVIKTARLYVQQVVALSDAREKLEDAPGQLAGEVAATRLTLVAGKFGLMDWFDDNAYTHDPRTQFMNWALANSAAWDYPADTFGYAWGFMAELHAPAWAVRAAAATEPKVANSADVDRRLWKAHGLTIEGERRLSLAGREGTARLLFYDNEARMGDYDDALALARQTGTTPDVTRTASYAHHKYGLTTSDDLKLSKTLGAFARLSWDDGRTETWSYDEVDGSAALGAEWTPARWGRPRDRWGAAQIVNVLSGPHRRYLATGGLGFMLGDGALHYGPEFDTETYYRFQYNDWLQVSPDAQLVVNPGYNRARGPVPIWAIRVHVQF